MKMYLFGILIKQFLIDNDIPLTAKYRIGLFYVNTILFYDSKWEKQSLGFVPVNFRKNIQLNPVASPGISKRVGAQLIINI